MPDGRPVFSHGLHEGDVDWRARELDALRRAGKLGAEVLHDMTPLPERPDPNVHSPQKGYGGAGVLGGENEKLIHGRWGRRFCRPRGLPALSARSRARERALANPAFAERRWQPGQSGNPGGKGGLYHEMVRLAREFTPDATRYLIEIAADKGEDARNRIVAMQMVLERAWGKPKEYVPPDEDKATLAEALSRLDPRNGRD
jgi:hypothetical protein